MRAALSKRFAASNPSPIPSQESAPDCVHYSSVLTDTNYNDNKASVHNYSHLYPCPSTNGSFTHTFCCDPLDDASDDTSPGGGCCDNTFVVVDFGSVDPNRTSSSTPSSSSSPQSSNTPTAIGAGVGVPLGVLLLAGLAYSWYRERASRRRVRERGEEGRERGSEGGKVGREQGSESRKVEPGGESGAQVHELEQVGGWAELHGQARAEVGNRLSV